MIYSVLVRGCGNSLFNIYFLFKCGRFSFPLTSFISCLRGKYTIRFKMSVVLAKKKSFQDECHLHYSM